MHCADDFGSSRVFCPTNRQWSIILIEGDCKRKVPNSQNDWLGLHLFCSASLRGVELLPYTCGAKWLLIPGSRRKRTLSETWFCLTSSSNESLGIYVVGARRKVHTETHASTISRKGTQDKVSIQSGLGSYCKQWCGVHWIQLCTVCRLGGWCLHQAQNCSFYALTFYQSALSLFNHVCK